MARPNAGDDSNPHSGEGGPRRTPASLAADPAFTGTYAQKAQWLGRNIRSSGRVFPVMSSPPTIAALTTTTGITSPHLFSPLSGDALAYPQDSWTYLGAARPTRYGATNPDFNYVKFQSFTLPTGNNVGHYSVEFYHYGTQVEFLFKGTAGAYQILVDDELVQAAPFSVSNTGSTYYQLVTFGSAAVRKIRFRGFNIPWGGANVATTDAIWPSEKRGPRVVFLGDSLTNGTGSTANVLTSWASWAAETLGWYDVYHAYAGGSGLTVAGTGQTYVNRVSNDVIANNPDIVWVGGWHNDDGAASTSVISTAMSTLLATIKAGLPNVQIIVNSSFWQRGPSTWPVAALDNRDAVKAVVTAAGYPFLDLLELPLNGRAVSSGTLASSAALNATSISVTGSKPGVGMTIQIGSTASGAGGDRRRITAVSGAGPYTVTLNLGLGSAQASGTVWTEVGPAFSDGDGYVGATTGKGPSDVLAASDGVHGTDAWHNGAGRVLAGQLSTSGLHY